MQRWDAASGLTFNQVSDGPGYTHPADIRIGFGKLGTSSSGIIAEANYGVDYNKSPLRFRPDTVIRLEDPSEVSLVWDAGGFTYQSYGVTLLQLVLHEVGHALGLDHSPDPTSIMYSHPNAAGRDLNADDIEGMQALYGPPAPPPVNNPPVENPPVDNLPVGNPPVHNPAVGNLVLHLSENAWRGDAQFVVMVDGQQVGGTQTTTAHRLAGQGQDFTISGEFGSTSHTVGVSFLNDAWGGSADADRNLFLDGAHFNGVAIPDAQAAFWSNGTATLATPGKADTITFNLSQDEYNGDAQAIVYVDGKQLGGVQTITAKHALGLSQSLTFTDAAGAGPSNVSVQFLNDAWGGTDTTDRNLYVDSIVIGGQHYDFKATMLWNQTSSFDIARPNTPSPAAYTIEQGTPYPTLLPA